MDDALNAGTWRARRREKDKERDTHTADMEETKEGEKRMRVPKAGGIHTCTQRLFSATN